MPLYDFICPECGYKIEAIVAINAELPLCIHCAIPMKRGYGSIAFYRMKGDIQGETPGARKYAMEITRKTRK